MTSTYDQYRGSNAEEAVRRIGESYERYFVPRIGRPSARPVIQTAELHEGERVLDVGCGTGVAARLAADDVGPSGSVTGVDPAPPMLAAAQHAAPDLDWRPGTAEALPVDDASYDAVVSSLAFQFFADRAQALHEIRRALAPGGRVVIGAPGPTPPLMREIEGALAEHVGPEAGMFVARVFAVHDPDEVSALLDGAGFADIAVQTDPLVLRVPPPADFFWQYVCSTPLAATVATMDDDRIRALEHDVVERTRPFLDGDELVMEPPLLVAAGEKR